MGAKVTKKIEEPGCCGQKECCESRPPEKQPSSVNKWLKIGLFALGVCLIIGATAYSLIVRHTSASNASVDTSGIPRVATGTCANALSTFDITDLVWVQELNSLLTNHDYIMVLLPENNGDLNNTLSNRMADATSKIEARGVNAATFTLDPSDPEFSTTMKRLALGQLPAIIAIHNNGNGALITGDITEDKLLQTYLVVSQPIICAPGSSSGCCSGK
jgi:hypothetical protein